jgi:carbamoyl-phosphate synthase large subunit
VLPTVGGQTALNLAIELEEHGVLAKYGVKLIGAQVEAIKVAEDRQLFREAMTEIGIDTPASAVVKTLDEALAAVPAPGFPRSSARRSRWAASAAASPTTSRSSARSPAAA